MYPNRNKRLITKAELFCHQDSLSGRVPVWFAMTLTVLILIFSGITYRVLAFRITDTSINLPVPLDKFPLVIGDWEGSELSSARHKNIKLRLLQSQPCEMLFCFWG